MAQKKAHNTVYTNDDLNRPLKLPTSKSPVWTNKDLKFQDDFEPDTIESKDDFQEDDFTPDTPEVTNSNRGKLPEADTWEKGFARSILNGDALNAGMQGLKGYAKGAILDIPETLIGGMKDIHDRFNPINVAKTIANPIGALRNDYNKLKDQVIGMRDTTANAGNEPEEFGRLMGQLTGQPLTTAGLIEGTPMAVRGAGYPAELLGKGLQKFTPASNVARGAIPAKTGIPYIPKLQMLRNMEGGIGRGLESLGQKMKGFGKTIPQSEIITGEDLSQYMNKDYTPAPQTMPTGNRPIGGINFRPNIITNENMSQMPQGILSDTQPFESYRPVGQINLRPAVITNESLAETGNAAASKSGYRQGQILDDSAPIEKSIITNEDLANLGEGAANKSGYRPNQNLEQLEGFPLVEGEPIGSYKVIREETPSKIKPRLKAERDGTFTNMDTGENVNANGERIIEIDKKPVDRNSSIFRKNRR